MAAASNGGPAAAAEPSGRDLLVVGPGVLGSLVGKLWLEAFPDSTVVGQTNSTTSHDRCAQHRNARPGTALEKTCACL